MKKTSILVAGSGIAGLGTALALARRGQQVALVGPRPDMQPPDLDEYHPRVYALSPESQSFLAGLGVWDVLPANRVTPVQAMEVYGDQQGKVTLEAWQAARPALAWIVEAGLLERTLAQAALMSGLTWHDRRCTGWHHDGQASILELDQGPALRADLVVAADGARSAVRAASGLAVDSHAYGEMGIVTHLEAELPHQGVACQWFSEEGIVALLPLPDTRGGRHLVSLVWSMPQDQARALLGWPQAQQETFLAERLAVLTSGRLGHLRVRSGVHGFPLFLEQTSSMTGPGLALVSDAGHRVHPLAGQGLNLGLGDVRALVDAVAGREPFRHAGDERVLSRYRRARAAPLRAMKLATHGLHSLFSSEQVPLVWLRNQGMELVERLPFIKRALIDNAAGQG